MTTTTLYRWMAAGPLVAALTGCEVTNPGPIQDESLDLPAAHQSLVNGAGAKLAQAIGFIATPAGLAAREIFPTGQAAGYPGVSTQQQAGSFVPNQVGSHWAYAQQARWIAEDAIRRFTELGAAKVAAGTFTEAYLWAGYANRLLGENMCEAVFNGGPIEPNVRYFERAQAAFTNAINLGSGNLKTAAYAGRASVRVWLKDWAGAASDAQQVPLSFVYLVVTDPSDQNTQNNVWYGNANRPYRTFTQWRTWFETYYTDSGDPRVPWGTDPAVPRGSGSIPDYGPVPWSFQQKYPASDSPFRVSSGRETVLIRAEALLTTGDWQGAMTLINSLRTSQISKKTNQPLTPWVATNLSDAWTFLKRERSIELWLEARRMGDLRRWSENKTPGEADWPNFETTSSIFRNNVPSQCFPIPDSERNTNPNF